MISSAQLKTPLLVFIIHILSMYSLHAQQRFFIKGSVTEKNNSLEYANIFLYADSTKIQHATISDSLGKFIFTGITAGRYLLKTSLTGYLPQQVYIDLQSNQTLGPIYLSIDKALLNTVEVIALRKQIRKTSTGFIVNARDNITQSTGTATDLLRNTPTIVVDAEGLITIRGKSPLILINGRNSAISNPDQIPASSIESLEIINNPSANYDADAEGGIINITLKKNKGEGTNGSLAFGAGAGAKGRINSAANFNHQQGKWNFGLGYDNRFAGRTRKVEAARTNLDLPDTYYLTQKRHDDRFEQTQNLKLNIDFQPNSNNSFSLEGIGNLDAQHNKETLFSTLEKQDHGFNESNSRFSDEKSKEKAAEFALNYLRKFRDIHKSLQANFSSGLSQEKENTEITTENIDADGNHTGDPYLQRTHNYQRSIISNLKIDYQQKLAGNNHLDLGYKGIARFTHADFQTLYQSGTDYIPNPKASNIFKFKEQVHAAYLQYHGGQGHSDSAKLVYDLGLRAEQVFSNGETMNNPIKFGNHYFNFFPAASLAYHNNPSGYYKISYNRRINRPGLGQLNPFIDITDSLNPHGGNPYLKPELVHALEAGYNKEWKKTSVSINLFYRYANNIIRQFITLDTTGIALVTPKNFGRGITYGLEGITTFYPANYWNLNASFSIYQQNIQGEGTGEEVANNLLSWYGKLINNFSVWKGGRLQVIANYNSPIATPQGTRIAVYNIDAGFQQKIWGGKGAMGIVWTDIFNTQKNGFTAHGPNFDYNRRFKVDTRAVLITFAYSFRTRLHEELLENKFTNE